MTRSQNDVTFAYSGFGLYGFNGSVVCHANVGAPASVTASLRQCCRFSLNVPQVTPKVCVDIIPQKKNWIKVYTNK